MRQIVNMWEALSTIVWDVDPVLLELGPLTFRYYGILFASALMVGYSIFRWQFEEYGEDPESAVKLTYALVAGIVLGARLGHVLFYEPERYWDACFSPLQAGMAEADCFLWLKFWKGGLASHGATLGIFLVLAIYSYHIRKLPFRIIGDRLSMGPALAVFFIRMGNLFNSEIVGRPTDSVFGFIFPRSVAAQPDIAMGPVVLAQPRHPSQLYEAAIGLFIFVILYLVNRHYKKKGVDRPLGLLTFIFVAVYFFLRFFAEFFKEYQTEFSFTESWTMGQWLSIPFTAFGLLGIWAVLAGPWKGQTARGFLANSNTGTKLPGAESDDTSSSKSQDDEDPDGDEDLDEDTAQDADAEASTDEDTPSSNRGPKRKLAQKKKKKKKR